MIVYRIAQELNNGYIAFMDESMIFRCPDWYPEFTDWFETGSIVRANRVAARWPYGTVDVFALERESPKQTVVQPSLWG